MKINFLVGGIFRSGGMRIIFEYANRLVSRGHSVVLYYPFVPYDFYKGNSTYLKIMKNYYWRIKELSGYAKIKETIFSHNFLIKGVPLINNMFIRDADATIATQWPTAFSLNKLNKSKGQKVYFIQDYEIWNSNPNLVDQSYKLNLNRVTISKKLQDFFLEKFNSGSTLIYNGIDFDFFNNEKKVSQPSKQLLFIDHYLQKKNIKLAIDISRKIKSIYPDIKVKCFGYQNYNKLPDWIDFTLNPSDNQIKEMYSKSDVFLFTSNEEGFGLPPAEAMACKCAVVSTEVGAVPEYSKNMETAILVPPGSLDKFLDGVRYLLNNEEELKRISMAGYTRVRKFFDWNSSVKKFEDLLKNNL